MSTAEKAKLAVRELQERVGLDAQRRILIRQINNMLVRVTSNVRIAPYVGW